MNNLKTGLIISTILIFLSIVFLQYDMLGVKTISNVFIIPAFIINGLLITKIFRNKKQTTK
jgi:hypothetical protein